MVRNISSELKSKILRESKQSGCVISELAKKYSIKTDRIYRWRLKDSSEQSSLSNENSIKSRAAYWTLTIFADFDKNRTYCTGSKQQ